MSLSALIAAEVASYEDTEWTGQIGGETVTLTSSPLTGADMTFVTRRHPNFLSSPTFEGMVELLVRKARTEKGDHAFSVKDKPVLMRFNTDKIAEMFGALFEGQFDDDDESHEARVKN